MSSKTILDLVGVTKRFPGVVALSCVDLQVRRGEIHGLIGERGAGKSTLTGILSGLHQPDEGSIFVNGALCKIDGPSHAAWLGLSFIGQAPTLFPDLSVTENLFPGGALNRLGFTRQVEAAWRTRELLTSLDLKIAPLTKIRDLRLAEAKMVEILRAVSKSLQILIMEEPTSSLIDTERRALFGLIASLKQQGVSIVYVSQCLDEVLLICDRVTVLKDGRRVGTHTVSELSKAKLIRMMGGRDVAAIGLRRGGEFSESDAPRKLCQPPIPISNQRPKLRL